MVDYLKVKKSVEEDKTIMSAIKDIYTDKDYLRLFQVLDRTLKCVLICMKNLVDRYVNDYSECVIDIDAYL